MTRDRRAGVSLLETMIALAVMGMIAVVLSSGLSNSARVLISSTEVTRDIDRALARQHLRSWLERAMPIPFPGQNDAGFRGTGSDLNFSFISDRGEFWAGDPVLVSLGADDTGAVILTAMGSADAMGTPAKRQVVLSDAKSTLTLRYFGRLNPEAPLSWLGAWQPEAGLPELVRITIANEQNGLPPLTINVGKLMRQREISLSSLVPPALPSRP